MDIIKRNQIRINELAAGSPELTNQALALDWNELQLALEECVFNQNLSNLPDKYEPASYFPIRPEMPNRKNFTIGPLSMGKP